MPPLKLLLTREFCNILAKNEFALVKGGKGSHIKMKRQLPNETIVVIVPNHGRKPIPRGMLSELIKQSKLPHSEFEERGH